MIPDKTPQNFYLGGGGETLMTLPGAIILLIAGVLILSLRRKYVIIPVLLAIFLVPQGEILVVSGFHLTPARLIALFGWIRIIWTKFSSGSDVIGEAWNSIDSAFLLSEVCGSCAFILLWLQMGAVFNRIGSLWGILGIYFLLRHLIRDKQDIYRAIKVFAVIAAINGVEMVHEQLKFQNLFGVYIGGVDIIPSLRDGKIRSQGTFGHPILAGTFAATLLPLMLALWKSGNAKVIALVGLLSALSMVYTSASSTPMLAIVAGLLGIFLWPVRRNMRVVRWSILGFLVVSQIFMKAPVWFLIARMDVLGASSGYHRAELVDVFIKHFFDWWLVGTRDGGSWGWEMFDLSNQYVSRGESGGLLAFIFFIVLISRSFARLGKARKSVAGRRSQEWLCWFLGAALFAHVMGFFGISYWDQTEVAWLALLAMISAATAPTLVRTVAPRKPAAITEPKPADVSVSRWETSGIPI